MKTETKHAPLPWRLRNDEILDNDNNIIAQLPKYGMWKSGPDGLIPPTNPDILTANGNFIVLACNNYERVLAQRDELAACLRSVLDMFERHIDGRFGPVDAAMRWELARAALAKLEEK